MYFSLEDSKKVMKDNGKKLAPKEVIREYSKRHVVNQHTPSGDISITQENISEVWTLLTYVEDSTIRENSITVLLDKTLLNGYYQIQKLKISHSNNIFKRIMNKGKTTHKKGSASSYGNSLDTYIGWENYPKDGVLNNYR